MNQNFQNKHIVITGGASGIGRLMAKSLASKGANVIILDVNHANLDSVVREIHDDGGKSAGYICDVGNFHEVDETKSKISADHGFVEILINNAGIVTGKYFVDLTLL